MDYGSHTSPPSPHHLGLRDSPERRPLAPGVFAAALFDFDGTLVDSEAPCATVFADIANTLGASMNQEEAAHICFGRSWYDACSIAAESYPILEPQLDDFIETIRKTIDLAGGFLGEPILPSLAALRQIAERMPVAVVSGSFRPNLITSLQHLGVAECVTTVIGSEDYASGKPNAEPFLVAARELGVSPSQCVVFEDSDVGIQAARAAGMRCIALRPDVSANKACISVERLDAKDVWSFLSKSVNTPAT